ncbi:Alpha/Beta hydrolase protein [Mariannaea sp. PMI_226]|nr:Alpha/Beta hydrolase protein [Mariannaea sp. PMI_226]
MAAPTQTQPRQTARIEGAEDEIFGYRIHVSTKYLDITRQKLELTRLPHEPRSQDWWEPKPQVESLIDYWQEHYSWHQHEERFNNTVPQFRTGFLAPPTSTQVRIHFVHARSPHPNAVPLLLIPPFPLTNLSLVHLIPLATNPLDPVTQQPFHLVMPALPGLGFSDPLPPTAPPISTTGEMLDGMMKRLGYPRYLATNSGAASMSPSLIDWRIMKHISQHYPDSCLGTHLISPPLTSPTFGESAGEWTKWTLARMFSSPVLGYSKEDFSAVQKRKKSKSEDKSATSRLVQLSGADYEPNTPSYALCDSPTGLLLYVMKILRTLSPKKELKPDDIITLTQLVWLPGPEAALRFWSLCTSQIEPIETTKPKRKPKVAVTVFLDNEDQSEQKKALPQPAYSPYSCPSWARKEFTVVHSTRVAGRAGFLSWDRPEIIMDGVRGLAKAVLSVDNRMQRLSQSGAIPSPQIIPEGEGSTPPGAPLTGTTARNSAATTVQPTSTPPGKTPSSSATRRAAAQSGQLAVGPQLAGGAPRNPRRTSPRAGNAQRQNLVSVHE